MNTEFKKMFDESDMMEEQLKAIKFTDYAVKFHREHFKQYDSDNPERIRLLTNAKRLSEYLRRGYSLMLLINAVKPHETIDIADYYTKISDVEKKYFNGKKSHMKSCTFIIGDTGGNMYGIINDMIDNLNRYKITGEIVKN